MKYARPFLLVLLFCLLGLSVQAQTVVMAPRPQNLRFTQSPLTYTTTAIAQTQAVMLTIFGDSLISTPDTLAEDFAEIFYQNYGFCGGTGGAWNQTGGRYARRFGCDKGGAGSYITNDLTRWYNDYTVLTQTGDFHQVGSYLLFTSSAGSGVTGNVFEVVFAVSNGYGGFAFATNNGVNGQPYTTIANVVCNTNALVNETLQHFRFTNASPNYVSLRATALSNFPVRIITMGIMDYTHPGVIWNLNARPSQTMAQFNSVPTNLIASVFSRWNSKLILIKTINGGSTSISNALPAFSAFINNFSPNADVISMDNHPIEVGDADIVAGNLAYKINAARYPNWVYFPSHQIFWDNWTNSYFRGYMILGNNVHLSETGSSYAARALWSTLNLMGDRGTYAPNSIPYYPFEYNSDYGYTYSGGNPPYADGNPATTNFPFRVLTASQLWGGLGLNGEAFKRSTNTGTIFPANYTVATQLGYGSSTNTSTATNALFGTIGTGSLTIPTDLFFNTNRTLVVDLSGDYWTGATPGFCRFNLTLGGANINVLTGLVTPPASIVQGRWEAHADLLLMTNSATVGAIMASGKVTFFAAGTNATANLTNAVANTPIFIHNSTTNKDLGISGTNGATTDGLISRQGQVVLR